MGFSSSEREAARADAVLARRFGFDPGTLRKLRKLGKPETFDFLGLTHIYGATREGKFTVMRKTVRQRLRAKLKEVHGELRRRLNDPIPEVGQWLRSVVNGRCQYYWVHGAPH